MKALAEPIRITGRDITRLKASLSAGVVITTAMLPVFTYVTGIGGVLAGLVGVPLLGLTVARSTMSLFARNVFRAGLVPGVPERAWMETSVKPSGETIRTFGPAVAGLLILGIVGLLGPLLVVSPIVVGSACLVWVWALEARVIAVDSAKMSNAEVAAWQSRGSRVKREANALLSQWLTSTSTLLALALIVLTVAAIIAPPRLEIWRWAILSALAYLIIGSLLRGAAESTNRVWIDIDVVRLWQVSRKTFLTAAATAGAGAALGALWDCVIWLSSNLKADGPTLDLLGRPITAGTVLGAIAGVLTVPRFAFIRRRELRREAQLRHPPAEREIASPRS
jgi:hypothetical protein